MPPSTRMMRNRPRSFRGRRAGIRPSSRVSCADSRLRHAPIPRGHAQHGGEHQAGHQPGNEELPHRGGQSTMAPSGPLGCMPLVATAKMTRLDRGRKQDTSRRARGPRSRRRRTAAGSRSARWPKDDGADADHRCDRPTPVNTAKATSAQGERRPASPRPPYQCPINVVAKLIMRRATPPEVRNCRPG